MWLTHFEIAQPRLGEPTVSKAGPEGLSVNRRSESEKESNGDRIRLLTSAAPRFI